MSIKKKRKLQSCGHPMLATASGKTTKANAGPPWTTLSMDKPEVLAMKPKMEKTTKPANTEVPQLQKAISTTFNGILGISLRVYNGYPLSYTGVSMAVVVELVVAGQGYEAAEGRAQRVKDLGSGILPDLSKTIKVLSDAKDAYVSVKGS
jgi:hypothetical protein